jgi:hypothetical protein
MLPESKLAWDQYLKFAAIPYAFGFFTVMLHTARYGFPVVQILQPLNFWIGVIPTLILAGGASSFIARSSWWERPPTRRATRAFTTIFSTYDRATRLAMRALNSRQRFSAGWCVDGRNVLCRRYAGRT